MTEQPHDSYHDERERELEMDRVIVPDEPQDTMGALAARQAAAELCERLTEVLNSLAGHCTTQADVEAVQDAAWFAGAARRCLDDVVDVDEPAGD